MAVSKAFTIVLFFEFPEAFHFLGFQKFIDAAQVFPDAFISELIYFGDKAVQEVPVVGNYNQRTVEIL